MRNIFTLGLISMTLAGCLGGAGGGGGGSSSGVGSNSTVFNSLDSSVGTISASVLDSAIEGLNYSASPSGLSGTTDSGGRLSCMGGDVVTLKLGQATLAVVPCRPVITPIEMVTKGKSLSQFGSNASSLFSGNNVVGFSNSESNALHRLVTLLQTLDFDGDLSNGILIQPSSLSIVQSILDQKGLTLSEVLDGRAGLDTEWIDALEQFANSAGGGYSAKTNLGSAMTHFLGTLSSKTDCQNSTLSGAQTVSGISGSCVALSCSSGYDLENGRCVSASGTSIFAGISSHTCLYGKMQMDGSNPATVNGNNPGFTLIVLDNNSNDAFVLRTPLTSDLDNVIDASQVFSPADYNVVRTTRQLKYFSAIYNRSTMQNNLNLDNLLVSNIGFADNANAYMEFITQSMPADGVSLMTGAGQFGTGLNSGEFDWHVEANCTLPTNIE